MGSGSIYFNDVIAGHQCFSGGVATPALAPSASVSLYVSK